MYMYSYCYRWHQPSKQWRESICYCRKFGSCSLSSIFLLSFLPIPLLYGGLSSECSFLLFNELCLHAFQGIFVSACLYAVVFGNVASILKIMDAQEHKYRSKMREVETFMTRRRFPEVRFNLIIFERVFVLLSAAAQHLVASFKQVKLLQTGATRTYQRILWYNMASEWWRF